MSGIKYYYRVGVDMIREWICNLLNQKLQKKKYEVIKSRWEVEKLKSTLNKLKAEQEKSLSK